MSILTGFDSFINDAQKNQSIVDLDSKRRILQTLSAYGLPTRKEEEWRNTSLKFLTEFDFKPVSKAPTKISELGQSLLQQKIIPTSQRIVFVNGFFMPGLSEYDSKHIGVKQNPDSSQPVEANPKAIQTWNSLYNLNPVEIIISSDLSKPLQILNLVDTPDVLSSPKVKVVLKANNEAKIVLTNAGPAQTRYFLNGKFSFEVEKDARLELINHTNQSVSAYHMDTVEISAASASTVRYFELNFNALLARHEFHLNLNGEHIVAEILAASYLKQKQHCDSQTYINHNNGHCHSEQIYKSVLDDESHSVFSGTVYIAPGIVKADSAQLNQNLLLSDHAEVNSKPVLRIFSDDVKASHGSTMGQIQEEEIFYLQSRSISRNKAIELLGQGFLNEIVLKINSEDLKTFFSKELLDELAQNRKPQLKVLK